MLLYVVMQCIIMPEALTEVNCSRIAHPINNSIALLNTFLEFLNLKYF